MAVFQQKIKGMLQIIRPELPLAAGMCVVIGELLGLGALPSLSSIGLGFALGFFLSSSEMVFNDYFDLEVDQINAPQRPLPAGILTRSEAVGLGVVTALIALAIAWALGVIVFALSLAAWVIGFLYNWKLKAAGLGGNLIVSSSVALTFIIGGGAVGQIWSPTVWTFGLFAFVFDLAEEIAGDALDAEGDQKRGSKSIAILYGKQTALRISAALFVLMVVLTFLPVAWFGPVLYYLIPIAMTDLVILFLAVKLLNSQTTAGGRKAMRWLYLSASFGLLIFLIGAFLN